MDELASDPLFDVDGCAEQLFLYLWTKNRGGSSCPGVRVPDTVRQLFPRAPRSPPLPARARPPPLRPDAPAPPRLPAGVANLPASTGLSAGAWARSGAPGSRGGTRRGRAMPSGADAATLGGTGRRW